MTFGIESLAFVLPIVVLSIRPGSLSPLWLVTERVPSRAFLRVTGLAHLAERAPNDEEPGDRPATSGQPRSPLGEPDHALRESRGKLRRSILLGIPLGIVSWLLIFWMLGVI